jgi:hypothetical protein
MKNLKRKKYLRIHFIRDKKKKQNQSRPSMSGSEGFCPPANWPNAGLYEPWARQGL